ncbi:prenyltransferase/squalene oxidase repeat-containing protein [Peribacillus psychrosaccharolyticus]|uniref:terpene cyclase/mutase family protein n=1 Tax=Peribacillus psychrosaccharolyticus TaxID=1407 RepID=UPI003D2D90D0
MQHVQPEINRLTAILQSSQGKDGSWHDPFETNIVVDAYMIILLRVLEIDDEKLIQSLVKRIESKRDPSGVWKLFADEKEGNLSLTTEAYYALLYSGLKKKEDPNMRKARRFILEKGGLKQTKMFTRLMLTVTGQYKWPLLFPIPIEAVLLPPTFFVNMFDISIYARVHFMPLVLLGEKKFQVKGVNAPDLSDLHQSRSSDPEWEEMRSNDYRSLFSRLQTSTAALIGLPSNLKSLAVDSIEQYMLNRLEPDGTLYNYFSSTFFMIIAFLSLGYSKKDPVIIKAVEGLIAMASNIDGQVHIQHTTANVWNTALISYALQESGLSSSTPSIKKATAYLRKKQHVKYGDWVIHNPDIAPGGWGFSDLNTINPDVDDTSASLRALHPVFVSSPAHHDSWERGVTFLLSMQNDDGGFPAFEKNVDNQLLSMLPVEEAKYILTDPSTPDLTGRALEFLSKYAGLQMPNRSIKKAADWLLLHQEENGSWYGRWGVCYIYGTWAALTGLAASGHSTNSAISRAVKWLKSIQNQDGGWGESCYSDITKKYVPLGTSSLTQTAWALDALIAVSAKPSASIEKGIAYLIREGKKNDWTTSYPAGQGLANFLYIHYHSYQNIFTLLTLAHYREKYLNSSNN